ncbi:hypothetical protein [Rubritalea marina]|uniref:hypothetical protein n=1 Tax=Rubritalea marina TaxID=361055 RepID=UPI000363F840|nr:hypothetical protein [Rubritalea marina]
MKAHVTRVLSQVIPGEWQVHAMYLDWRGRVHLVGIQHPDLSIGKTTVTLNWSSLSDGMLKPRQVAFYDLIGDVDLAKFRRREIPSHAVPPIAKLASKQRSTLGNQGQPIQAAPEPRPVPSKPQAPSLAASDSLAADEQLIQRHALSVTASTPTMLEAADELEKLDDEMVLRFEQADLEVSWDGKQLAQLLGVQALIPISGADVRGFIRWDGLRLFNQPIMGESALNLHKSHARLTVEEPEVEIMGMHIDPQIGIINTNLGLVYMLDVQLPEQPFKPLKIDAGAWSVSGQAESVGGRFQAIGPIFRPLEWRAKMHLISSGVEGIESHNKLPVRFDLFQASAQVHRGEVLVPELALLGEQFSFRGNGRCRMNGRGYGVLRVMAPEQQSFWLNDLWQTYCEITQTQYHGMQALGTGDLNYADIKVDGFLWEPYINVASSDEWHPVKRVLIEMLRQR